MLVVSAVSGTAVVVGAAVTGGDVDDGAGPVLVLPASALGGATVDPAVVGSAETVVGDEFGEQAATTPASSHAHRSGICRFAISAGYGALAGAEASGRRRSRSAT